MLRTFPRCIRTFSTQTASPPQGKRPLSTYLVWAGSFALGFSAYNLFKKQYSTVNSPAADQQKVTEKMADALNPSEFVPFQLSEVHKITHDTSLFRFALPLANQKLGLSVASCVLVRVPEPGKTKPDGTLEYAVRPYTPTSDNDALGYFDFVIKKYETGKVSKAVHELQIGEKLEVKGPLSKHKYSPNMYKEIGMIAGGSGITPMFQVIRHSLKNPDDNTKIHLIFANRTPKDVILHEELDKMAKENPDRFKVHYTVDSKSGEDWSGFVGYVSEKMVQDLLPSSKSSDIKIMVCGPPPMMKLVSGDKGPNFTQGSVDGILKKLGYTENQVYKF